MLYKINVKAFDAGAQQIIEKYHEVTHPMQLNDSSLVHVPVKHYIETGNSSPVSCRPRPLSGEKLRVAKEEFLIVLEAVIIRRSNSPWLSQLQLAPKHERNTLRPCGDFRRLNAITKDDRYPIPHIRSTATKFHD